MRCHLFANDVSFVFFDFPSIAHRSLLAMPTTKPDPERLAILKAHLTFGARLCIVRPCVCVCVCPFFWHMCICQEFYKEKMENDYRQERFMDLGQQNGFTSGKLEKMLKEGKVLPKFCFCSHIPPHDYLCTGACLLEVPPIKFTFLDIKKTGMNEDMDILACLLDSLEKKQRQTSLSIRFKSFDFSFFSGTSSEKKDSNKANLIIHITIWMILPDMIILIYLDNLDILFQHFFRGCVCVCAGVFSHLPFFFRQIQQPTNVEFALGWLPSFAINPPTEKETKDQTL